MHELSLTQGIVTICLQHAHGKRVTSVTVEIGLLGSVVPEAVEFCFSACSSGTLLEDACLVIERIAGRGCCTSCGSEQLMEQRYDPCCVCGSHALLIVAGEEMRVREIEVED